MRVELRQWCGDGEKREEEVFRWQNRTGSLYHTAVWSTKHTLFCMKMTLGVGEAGSPGGLSTMVRSRFLVCMVWVA